MRQLLVILALFAFTNLVNGQGERISISNYLAKYSFEKNTNDSTGNHNLTASGTGTSFNGARVKDGNYSLDLTDAAEYFTAANFPVGDNGSMSVWVYFTLANASWNVIASIGTASDNIAFFSDRAGYNDFDFLVTSSSSEASAYTNEDVAYDITLIHYLVTWSKANGRALIYVNNVNETIDGVAQQIPISSGTLYLNRLPGGTSPFVGFIDKLEFWNDTITATQVDSIYNYTEPIEYGDFDNSLIPWHTDSFNLLFVNDFEDNTLGVLADNQSEWEDDWNDTWHFFTGCWITNIIQKGNTKAMEINFPDSSEPPEDQQGVDFTLDIPGVAVDSSELYLSYDVMFRPGFDFVISGKTGGHMNVGHDWAGEEGRGENNWPNFDEGGRFGLSWLGDDYRGGNMSFYFYWADFPYDNGESRRWEDPDDYQNLYYFDVSEEVWVNITIRMVCNTVNDWENEEIGNNDGYAEGFINGKLMTRWDHLRMRDVDTIGINQLVIFTQFGGAGPEFSPTRDEWLLTDNYHIWSYAEGVTQAPTMYQKSPPGRILHLPEEWTNATLVYDEIDHSQTIREVKRVSGEERYPCKRVTGERVYNKKRQ